MGLQQIEPQANGLAANAQITGDAFPVKSNGYIVYAGFGPLAGAGRARVRARIDLLGPVAGDGTRPVLGSLWQGYARAGGQPMSIPNCPVERSWAVRVVAAASNGWTTGRVTGQVWVSKDPLPGAPFVYTEPVGPQAGPGDLLKLDINDPATGTQYGLQTVGARTVAMVRAWFGGGVWDATVATRVLEYYVDDGTNQVAIGVSTSMSTTPSTTYFFGAAGGAAPGNTANGALIIATNLPEVLLEPGYRHRPFVFQLQAGDELVQGFALMENWAVIL